MRYLVRKDRPQAECHIMCDSTTKAVMYNNERDTFCLSGWIPEREYKFIEEIDFFEVGFFFPNLTLKRIDKAFNELT